MKIYEKIKCIYQTEKRNFIKTKEYKDKNILTDIEGNEFIKNKLLAVNSYSIARIGETELSIIKEFLKGNGYSNKSREFAFRNAGIFPNNDEELNKFSNIYLESIKSIDLFGVWFNKGEGAIIEKFSPKAVLSELRALEPYYFDMPWSEVLKNKKVLVIHPFENSIINQYKKYKDIFENKRILPEFQLLTLKAVQSISGNDVTHKSWSGSLNYMKNEINKYDFDIAIIGAGAYGLPLASYIKNIGKIAIHMGGATQILFGIKGRRWDNHPIISNLYNEYWVRPLNSEKIVDANKVEGATYW